MDARVTDYFEQLTAQPVSGETPIALTSAKIGAAQAWLRRQGMTYDPSVLGSGRFTLAQLMNDGAAAPSAEEAPLPAAASPAQTAGREPVELGVDIEAVSSLPEADDLRAHGFYADNFTAAELAYCLERRDPRESLCGLWAAKEAIRKLDGAGPSRLDLKAIEITHGPSGAPTYPGLSLSISHAGGLAIAVAARARLVQAPASPPAATPPAVPADVAPGPRISPISLLTLALSIAAVALALAAVFKPAGLA